jgi:hypothetical protein
VTDAREDLEVEALVTDRYLDSLLAARSGRAPEPRGQPDLEPAAGRAADVLHAQLARIHPSFRFEERLAADLQSQAARALRGGRALRPAVVRRLDPRSATPAAPLAAAPRATSATARVARPLLIGGALTSAALSLAGAYVAWRRGRRPIDPMVRAVRAAHRTGLAQRIVVRPARVALSRGRGRR